MDKGSSVREMFQRIARRYDLANTFMSCGLDVLWRKQAVASLALAPDARVLDLCCGTGGLTRELARHVPDGAVTGIDFSDNMLAVARSHRTPANVTYVQGDVLSLPFEDGSFDAAAMGFSLRNVADIGACLREISRILRPGGAFVNLEIGKPPNPVVRRAFYAYFYGALPLVGWVVGGDRAAYHYLPQSLVNFPDARALADLFKKNGFPLVRCVPLLGGMAYLHAGVTATSRATRAVPQLVVSNA
ncbi:MAG TPA: bifunctional demethylmenaquinone methyltransferase/2-methoxy-6-polyprenyl-1,4-benzoquinol methylase UbiE [Candidatus Acidoferrales bacterium]|nr:bifunctional demethylmenaquinone methyltransferase/2-methoxy-6-polyprenyl-1,4-benzoquinol methylase UbiE [Candidatus Acidoferrales bacterium]